ncbi:UNVERIFIED_CONTAM: hypothetical protein Slati_2233400, partial [Sesamum latifolium]
LIEKIMEVYINDMVLKFEREEDHLGHLKDRFNTIRHYGTKLNLLKCTFGVKKEGSSWAIMDMESPTLVKKVPKLIGRIASLGRFLSQSMNKSLPFFITLSEGTQMEGRM